MIEKLSKEERINLIVFMFGSFIVFGLGFGLGGKGWVEIGGIVMSFSMISTFFRELNIDQIYFIFIYFIIGLRLFWKGGLMDGYSGGRFLIYAGVIFLLCMFYFELNKKDIEK